MSTTKLTDSQLVILAQAAHRPGGYVLPLPSSLKAKGRAITNVLKSLLKRGLIAEQPTSRDDEEWRRDDNGARLTLVIAPAGLSALGLGSDNIEADAPGTEDGTGQPESAHPDDAADTNGDTPGRSADASKASQRTGTKAAAIIVLIGRETGATLSELMAASGWQAHSVRGFLSGTLRKRHGHAIISEKSDDGARRYRIAS